MRTLLVAAAALLVAREAAADCVYHNDYYDPGVYGSCTAELTVPAGCPVHVATPSGDMPRFEVYRAMEPVTLPASTSLVDTVSVPMERVDPFDCFCTRIPGAAAFDRYEVTVTGAVEGDVIGFDSGQLETGTAITVGPPGPCPAAVWPTTYTIATRCDRCPDPADSGSSDGGAAGCSVGDDGRGSPTGALGALVCGLLVLRRRRAIARC